MSNLQQLANLLLKTTQPNTSAIRQAETNLEHMSKDQSFIALLLSIPEIQGISSDLARIASIYALTYAKNLVRWADQILINIAAQAMFDFIANKSVNYRYRDQIGAALQFLILKDHKNIIMPAFMDNTKMLLQASLNAPANQINFEFIAILCDSLSDKAVPATGANVQSYIKQCFYSLTILVKKALQYSLTFISSDQSQIEHYLLISTKMLKTLKKHIKKFMYFSPQLSMLLLDSSFSECINFTLSYNLPGNSLQIPLFYLNSKCNANRLVQLFHCVKGLTVYILTQGLRLVLHGKGKNGSGGNAADTAKIVGDCGTYLEGFVKGISELLGKVPCNKIKSKLVFKIIQEAYNFIVLMVRSCKYYNILNQMKPLLVFDCLFKTLAFTPQDYQNYYHDPEEFVNSLFHIIQINSGFLLGNDQPEMEDYDVNLQIFDTVKTNAANLLKIFVKYIDSTLAQLMYYITNVLQDKINLQYSKNLMLLIICILRDEIKARNDMLYKIKKLVLQNLNQLQIPTKSVEQPYNVQYCLNLLVVSRYLIIFDELIDDSNTNQKVMAIVEKLLTKKNVEQVGQIIGSEILLMLLKTEDGTFYCRKAIQLLNSSMSAKKVNPKFLQSILIILKQNYQVFRTDYSPLIQMLQKISALLEHELKKQQKNPQIVTKLWHIFQQIAQNRQLCLQLAETLRRTIQPLLNMIDGEQPELEERLYKIMENIVQVGQVTQFQLQILAILPKTFYTGKGKKRIINCFGLLQLIIYKGKELLTQNLITIKNLILLSIENVSAQTVNSMPRCETDCLQGILILQSLIISLGQTFPNQIWMLIAKNLTSKLEALPPTQSILSQNITSTLSLMLCYPTQFPVESLSKILSQIFQNFHTLSHAKCCKIFIITSSILLSKWQEMYIMSRFVQILDCTITLMKTVVMKRDGRAKGAMTDGDFGFQDKKISQSEDLEAQCERVMAMVVNRYDQVDQFQYFRQVILQIKQRNLQILQAAYQQLPETKKKYLKDILNTKKVKDQPRVIYKIRGIHQNANTNTNTNTIPNSIMNSNNNGQKMQEMPIKQ